MLIILIKIFAPVTRTLATGLVAKVCYVSAIWEVTRDQDSYPTTV